MQRFREAKGHRFLFSDVLFFKVFEFELRIFAILILDFRLKILDFKKSQNHPQSKIFNLKSQIKMSRDTQLKERWEKLVDILSNQFSQGEDLDLDAIIYLIGVQELGKVHREFKKDEKLNLMHIAICRLLEPYGFYEFDFFDAEGWPHYKVKEELPPLKAGEQSVLMKEAIVNYFLERELID